MTTPATGATVTRTDADGVATVTLRRSGPSSRSRAELTDVLRAVAEPFRAETALQCGLVHRVVQPGQVLAGAQALATRLAQGPTAAYRAVKTVLATAATDPLENTLALGARLQSELGQTADHREAVEAFLAKRTPALTGR